MTTTEQKVAPRGLRGSELLAALDARKIERKAMKRGQK